MKTKSDFKHLSRRQFIRVGTIATATLPVVLASSCNNAGNSEKQEVNPEWRNRQSGMAYRKLGRTGFMISEVVNGGDTVRNKTYRHVEYAIEKGLNYFDTAPAYGRGESEEGYGKILSSSSMREKVFINTKISGFKGVRNRMYKDIFEQLPGQKKSRVLKRAEQMRRERQVDKPGYYFTYWPGQEKSMDGSYLTAAMIPDYAHKVEGSKRFRENIYTSIEGSLERVGTDYFDLVMCPHGADAPEDVQVDEVFRIFEDLKKEGKIRYMGVSSHNDPAGIIRAANETGKYDVAMVAYNFLNGSYLERAIKDATDAGMGIIGMKVAMGVSTQHKELQPLPAWREEKLNRILPGEEKAPVRAYLWALQNPYISAVISNLWDEQHVDENLSVVGRKVDLQTG